MFSALYHKAFYLAHFVRLASDSCLKLVEGDGGDLIAKSCPIPGKPARLLYPWHLPGKTGVGCHSLLQRTLLTPGSNLGFLHCRQTLYQGSPTPGEGKVNKNISIVVTKKGGFLIPTKLYHL